MGQQEMTRPNNRPRSKGVGQCHNLTHETENDWRDVYHNIYMYSKRFLFSLTLMSKLEWNFL